MYEQLEAYILGIVQTMFDQLGWLGVLAILAFENATGVTPSELVLGLAGWMLIEAKDNHPSMILLGGLYAAMGSVLGSSIAYWVARKGGRPVVERLARIFRIAPDHIINTEKQFHNWGFGLVCFGRVIPGVRTLVSLPAGLTRMPFGKFVLATFIGTYVWCTMIIGLGYVLGVEWALVSSYLKEYLPYIIIFGVMSIAGYAFIFFRRNQAAVIPVPVREHTVEYDK